MPAPALIVSSLGLAESADMVDVCQYVSDEIQEILDTEQVNSSVIADLLRMKTVMDEIVTYYGG